MTVQLKLDARMRQTNTPDLSAMECYEMPTLLRLEKNVPEWFEETLAKTATEEHENVEKMTQTSKLKLNESHYLGWIFPLSGLDIPIIWAGYFCSLSPLQGAPCPPYRLGG